MVICTLPMVLIAAWLGSAQYAVYGHYLQTQGSAALHDQHLAATIMWAGCLLAFVVPALRRVWIAQRGGSQHAQSQHAAAPS